jgi:hypothetical protein
MKPMKKKASMMKKVAGDSHRIGNEKGSAAIVLAVMILVVVSLIGIQSSNTSTMEVQISAAERTAKQNFYKAEGAALRAAQEIENADSEILNERLEPWINRSEDVNLQDTSQWDYDKSGSDDTAEAGPFQNTYFGVMDKGVPQGSSLHMGHNTQVHTFRVFGRCIAENQSAFIEMGYKRRY